MGSHPKLLDGIRVVDLSTFVTGGFCSLMLANQGADVIKVEQPGSGDDIRHSGPPFVDGDSPYYWTVNYGKRSVELDLGSDAGLAALYDLAASADVLVQNFRPGTAERLGVGYDAVRDRNRSVVYCDISAFGDSGPWSERPGYDLLVQGLSGIMSVTGEPDGGPAKVGLPVTDLVTAMWAAFGIMSGLYRRSRTGEGEYVELGMLDAILPWLTKQAGTVFAGETPRRMGTKDPVLAPYQTFKTADGYINVACLNEKLWRAFCGAIGRKDLLDDDRFAGNARRVKHMDALEAELRETLSERPTDGWMETLVDAGVPAAPVQDVSDALYNEQTDARGMVHSIEDDGNEIPVVEHPLNFEHLASGFETPPPDLGEHNREVFRELGYDEAAIDAMTESGAFGGS